MIELKDIEINKELRCLINLQKSTKSKDLYFQIFESIMSDKPRCIDCNNPIYYYDSSFSYSTKTNKVISTGKSFKSIKKVNGKEYSLKICQCCLEKKYIEYSNISNKGRIFNMLNKYSKYAYSINDEDYNIAKELSFGAGMSFDKCIKRHGIELGNKIWNEYCSKQSYTNSFEYYKETKGWTKEEWTSYNKSRASTLQNMIKRHGEIDGRKLWDNYCKRQAYTNNLEYFIEKYGNEKGILKFNNAYQKRYSNISQIVFNKLDEYFKEYKTYYATKNHEYVLACKNKTIFLDYFIKDLKVCVEFNGDAFHANPKIFKKDDHPHPFDKSITSNDIWNNDKNKIDLINKEHNISTIIIWESDVENLDYNKLVLEIKKYGKL